MKTADIVAAFLTAKRAGARRPTTVDWYVGILRRLVELSPDWPQGPEVIEQFLSSRDISDQSRYSYWRALVHFGKWSSRRYEILNPTAGAEAPRHRKKLPRTLSSPELGSLFLAAGEPRDRALITLLVDTGVRISEALGLRVEDIGLDTIWVDGKTGMREVPISQETRRQLLELADSGYIFKGYGDRMSRQGAHWIVRNAFRRAGITGKKCGPHTLRHTFGRQWIVNGGDLVSLQRILGHTNIQTTRIYAELSLQDVLVQHAKYSPLSRAFGPIQGSLFPEAVRPTDRPARARDIPRGG